MHVWLSTIGQRLDHAENTRTMLLARFLIEAGHSVTLWTSAYDHIRKQWRSEWDPAVRGPITMDSGLVVRFMKGCGYGTNISLRRLVDHILAARDFRRQARDLAPPDIVVASLPDHITAAAMVDYAKEAGVPSIIDVRDKWPDIFVDYAPAPAKPMVKTGLLIESRRAKQALQNADALVAMMRSMLDWAFAKSGRTPTPADRIFYLATMDAVDAASAPITDLSQYHRDLLAKVNDKTVFVFVGTYNRTQHPLLVLDAFDLLSQRPDIDMDSVALLVGGDGVDADEVDCRIAAHPQAHKLGWLKPDEMRAILTRSDVGMLPLNFASAAFNNKAFAYLASGIPILNCATGDLAELIEQNAIGINLMAGDAKAMAQAMASLANDQQQLEKMKRSTRDLFAKSFDQQKIYSEYVAYITALAAGNATADQSG